MRFQVYSQMAGSIRDVAAEMAGFVLVYCPVLSYFQADMFDFVYLRFDSEINVFANRI